MLGVNTTDIIQTLQTGDYYNFLYNMATTTYLELFTFTIGIVLYAVFIWFFYRNLSKRDLFKLDLSRYDRPEVKHKTTRKAGSAFLYILKYFIIFPFYVVVWFLIFLVFLLVLAENVTLGQIALISGALVSTVRITSYLKEDLSHDLAKLTPLVILGVFLTDPNFFSFDLIIGRLQGVPSLGWQLLHFISFCILLEWVLRILYSLIGPSSPKPTPTESQ